MVFVTLAAWTCRRSPNLFDNQRILHGRSEYDHGRRHLQGCCADKDTVRSRIRVLEDA